MTMENTTERLDLGRFVTQGWTVYRGNFPAVLMIVLAFSLPVNIALSMLPSGEMIRPDDYQGFGRYLALAVAMGFVSNTFIVLALSKVVESSVAGSPVGAAAAFRHAYSRWGAGLSTGLVAALIVLGLSLLFVVPGIVRGVAYSFCIMLVSLRGLSGNAALERSRSLVRGRWWQVFWYQFVFFLFTAVVTAAVRPLLVLFPPVALVDVVANTIHDLFYACSMAMSISYFLELEAVVGEEKAGS